MIRSDKLINEAANPKDLEPFGFDNHPRWVDVTKYVMPIIKRGDYKTLADMLWEYFSTNENKKGMSGRFGWQIANEYLGGNMKEGYICKSTAGVFMSAKYDDKWGDDVRRERLSQGFSLEDLQKVILDDDRGKNPFCYRNGCMANKFYLWIVPGSFSTTKIIHLVMTYSKINSGIFGRYFDEIKPKGPSPYGAAVENAEDLWKSIPNDDKELKQKVLDLYNEISAKHENW